MNRVLSHGLVCRRPGGGAGSGARRRGVAAIAATDRRPAAVPRRRRLRLRRARRVRCASPTRPRRTSTCAPRARPSSRCPTARRRRCRSTRRWKTSRRATSRSASTPPTWQMLAGMRDERQSALKQRALALLVTEIQQLESLLHATENTLVGPAQAAPPSRGGLRRARERGLPREDGGRGRRATPPRRRNPRERAASSSRSPTRARRRWSGRARRPSATTRCSSTTTPVSRRPRSRRTRRRRTRARRGLLLPRLRVRAVRRHGERAPRLPRPHHEDAELEVHLERVPRVRRALLQRGAGRPDEVGAGEAGVPEGHHEAAARQQGLRLRLVQARVRLLEPGRPAARARRVQEDDRLRDARSRSSRTRRSSPRARARTSSRSTRSRAARPTRTTSSRT